MIENCDVSPPSHPLLWMVFGGLSVVFHLGLIFSGLVPNLVSKPLHLALALPWIFLSWSH